MAPVRIESGLLAASGDVRDKVQSRNVQIHEQDMTSPSRKRLREASATEEVMMASSHSPKRGRVLPVRGKDGDDAHFETHTSFSVDLPVSEITTGGGLDSQAVEQLGEETLKKSQAPLPVETNRAKDAPSSTSPVSQASARRMRTIAEPKDALDDASDEPDDSEDDAPEEVGAQDAADTARAAARDAARAAGLQEEVARRKRREKSGKLQKQAEEASKRRETAKRKQQAGATSDPDEDAPGLLDPDDNIDVEDEEQSSLKSTKLPQLDRANLPEFLPLEYLSDTEDPPVLALSTSLSKTEQARRPNKIKFLDEKKPKDIVRGRTVYRVAKKDPAAGLLAPKADKNARNLKDGWLAGRRGTLGESVRRKPTGGFFVR